MSDNDCRPDNRLQNSLVGLIASIGICFTAGGLGSLATTDAGAFYSQLLKPQWAPPGKIFGPVWSALYFLMGVSVWLVQKNPEFKRADLKLFGMQLFLNAIWSWLFFGIRSGALAMLGIIILLFLIVATMLSFRRFNHTSAILLIPYLLWVGFASILTWVLWKGNPDLL